MTGPAAEASFRLYVSSRQRALLRAGWLLTGNWAEAEDLVQTALMRCWPRWDAVARSDGADAYVHRALVNSFISSRRRRWHGERSTAEIPEALAPDNIDLQDLRSDLMSALQTLPPRQRAVLVLRYFHDLSEAQTAAALGCSTGTVKSQTSKAIQRLRLSPVLSSTTPGADRARP